MTPKKVVFVVAGDLGFVCWLGLSLNSAGFHALPAKRVSDAKRMIRDFSLHVDVLIIDPQLTGASKFAESLQAAPHHARIIAATAGTDPEKVLADPPFELAKAMPRRSDQQAAVDWVHTVESQVEESLKPALNF